VASSSFQAWHLPGGIAPRSPRTIATVGRKVSVRAEDPESIGEICRHLVRAGDALRDRPAIQIVEALGRVGRRFLDPGDPLREEALDLLPDTAGFSIPMTVEILDGMALDWTPERLEAVLTAEFLDPGVLDGFVGGRSGREILALGPELAFHVGAGNIPGVSVTSMMRALMVKSPVLLKPGRADLVLPVLFGRALREADPVLGAAVATTWWSSEEVDTMDEALGAADLVVAYGSDAVVSSLRDRTPPSTRFIPFHHRVSLGVLGRDRLTGESAGDLAGEAARTVALFDQRGCVSPHVFYVEEGGSVGPREWAALLADRLEEWSARLPAGPLEPDEASRIQQVRGEFEMRSAAGQDVALWSGAGLGWTVAFDPDPSFRASCLGRVVRVLPIPDLRAVLSHLEPVSHHLQTVALETGPERRDDLALALARLGASRITTLSDMPWPPPWWHHDGAGPLRSLVRWADLDS
jgi:hypothetical protein